MIFEKSIIIIIIVQKTTTKRSARDTNTTTYRIIERRQNFDADDDDAELAICTRGAGMGSEEGKGACVEGGAEEVTAVHYFEKVWKWFLRVALSKSPDWRTRRYFCVRD